MKINKTILVGIIFIIVACLIFTSNTLNHIIRPVTYLFLMGSSKGKDIIFFGLMGLFLICSQLFPKKQINSKKYLKIVIVLASSILIMGILLEVLFRYENGIALNTIFMTARNGISSTSILHTHLLKSIFGEVVTNLIGPLIESNINTGVGLYPYVPSVGKILILLLFILFVMMIPAIRNRPLPSLALLSFFASCLLIGILDGGLFSTPAITGICGVYLIYRNGNYIDYYIGVILKDDELISLKPDHKKMKKMRFIITRFAPYIIAGIIIFLRLSICFIGAENDYYTVEVVNPDENIELKNFSIENITFTPNKTIYHINNQYNEMKLVNDLKEPLNNSCDYYTLSWNMFSYLDDTQLTEYLLNLKKIF